MPTDTTDLSTIYTTPEEGDVYDFDQLRVGIIGSNGSYLLHQFKKTNENRNDNIKIRAVARSTYAPSSSPVYLQIWNGTTLQWDTVVTVNDKLADTDFSMDILLQSNEIDYYDFGNQIAVRVYQLNASGSDATLSIDQIAISFIPRYTNQYQSVKTAYVGQFPPVPVNYTDMFPKTNETSYTPKYPSKNPQDDL